MTIMRCGALAILALLVVVSDASAQTSSQDGTQALIRRLDAAEADGLLRRDSTLLRRIWSPDFTVNNPRNSVTRGSDGVVALIRNGTIDYSSFVREIETMVFHGKTLIYRRVVASVVPVFLAGASACVGESSPLQGIGDVSGVVITTVAQSPTQRVVKGGPRIDSLVEFVTRANGWEESSHTLPTGRYAVRFMRDTVSLGVLWIGTDFVVARRFGAGDSRVLIRDASQGEMIRLASWLDLPHVIMHQ